MVRQRAINPRLITGRQGYAPASYFLRCVGGRAGVNSKRARINQKDQLPIDGTAGPLLAYVPSRASDSGSSHLHMLKLD